MADLTKFPYEDGVFIISTPQLFHGGEEAYELAIGSVDGKALQQGAGAMALVNYLSNVSLKSFLEIGAGSGACSLGLIAAAPTREA